MVSRVVAGAVAALIAAQLADAATARPAVHKALTLAEAQSLVAAAPASRGFPVAVNAAVLKRLNGIITDVETRSFTRDALLRMNAYRPVIAAYLKKYGHPRELLAIPLVESAYRSLKPEEMLRPAGSDAPRSAGLWQFIPGTARSFGLRVDEKVDQRLNIHLETDAAMRLLGSHRQRFGSWLLALAAYNRGEAHVRRAIRKAGTRDPWRLVETKHLNDYIVYITAGVILIDHPQLLN